MNWQISGRTPPLYCSYIWLAHWLETQTMPGTHASLKKKLFALLFSKLLVGNAKLIVQQLCWEFFITAISFINGLKCSVKQLIRQTCLSSPWAVALPSLNPSVGANWAYASRTTTEGGGCGRHCETLSTHGCAETLATSNPVLKKSPYLLSLVTLRKWPQTFKSIYIHCLGSLRRSTAAEASRRSTNPSIWLHASTFNSLTLSPAMWDTSPQLYIELLYCVWSICYCSIVLDISAI